MLYMKDKTFIVLKGDWVMNKHLKQNLKPKAGINLFTSS